MAVNLKSPKKLHPVQGVRIGTASAAIAKRGRKDLVVFELAKGSRVAGVFTKNAFAAPPVELCRERLAGRSGIRALLVNAGNANAATGRGGRTDAISTCTAAARALGVPLESVLPFSTGVIGQRLPVARMREAIPRAASKLSENGWLDAAAAIMTTDTVPKGATRRIPTRNGPITVTGIAKGVGMLCPDMATLLAFIATDARLPSGYIRTCLRDAVAHSFNAATIDGDTSTNDSCVLVSSNRVPVANGRDRRAVGDAIREVCLELAQAVVRDGEGATKFVTIEVSGARSEADARRVARSIAHSPLVKTALFAGDANWGRLVMAIGNAGVRGLSPEHVSLYLDKVQLLRRGQPHPRYRERDGAAVLARPEFGIRVNLGMGRARTVLWTCDLSYDYVKINAEYRT